MMIKSKRARWMLHVARMGWMRISCNFLDDKPHRQRTYWRHRYKWTHNIKMKLSCEILWTQWSTCGCLKQRGSSWLSEWLHCLLKQMGVFMGPFLWDTLIQIISHLFSTGVWEVRHRSGLLCHEGTVRNRVPKEGNGVTVCTGWLLCLRIEKGCL